MSDQKEQALLALLAETFGADLSGIGPEDDLVNELDLDSLAGLRLLAAIEKRFSVHFPDERLGDFRTLGQILDFVAAKDKEKRP